ncbi:hypothetical protein AALP_AA2G096700 [Arabis alpina]|uniref:Photosystem II core complex proteins psbY n=1 Tax=Arabis alpina TaxID=50452 RepID=A0A087HGD3_ARAAL|nr:hypothetical protein AALP_AA2G096700 [Arabis alpina]
MAATMATSAKCMSLNPSPPKSLNSTKPISKPFISLPTPPKPTVSLAVTSTALAGAVFSSLSYSEPAFAAHQIAQLAAAATEGSDNRGLALLLPIVPAIAWVLFNILQPALNQINKMREPKGIVVGLGIGGGLAAAGLLTPPPEASAAAAAAAASGDNRGQLLLFVVAPALLWVLYNILQPALNQINKMRSE